MSTKSRKIPLILRTTPTDFDYAHYHSAEELAPLRMAVREKKYTTGHTAVTYRVLGHWAQNGLIPDEISNGGGWHKFSIVERAWVEVIKKLREFGLSLEKIAQVRESIMWWNDNLQSYPDFEYFLMKALSSDVDTYILALSNGKADVGTMGDIETSKVIRGNKDILLISLKAILEGFGLTVKKPKPLVDLTDGEIELLFKIRVEGSNEIKIKIENGKIKEIESASIKTHTKTDPLSFQGIRDSFKEDSEFGNILIQMEDGYPRTSKITHKKKLN